MEKFQIISTVFFHQGSDLLCIKLIVISTIDTVHQLFFCKIRQKQLHNFISCLLIGKIRQCFQPHLQPRNSIRHKQSAILCQPL